MQKPLVLAYGRKTDGIGNIDNVFQRFDDLQNKDFRLCELVIDPLFAGWDTPVKPGHYRSGCAPLEALDNAYSLIIENQYDAVLIQGKDDLKTGKEYSGDKRKKWMAIYNGITIPEAYNKLADTFIKKNGVLEEDFFLLVDALYQNHKRAAIQRGIYKEPDIKWFEKMTPLFRGVDCANPYIDFHGAILMGNSRAFQFLFQENEIEKRIEMSGTGLGSTVGDGEKYIEEIVEYKHLQKALKTAEDISGISLKQELFNHNIFLELYTCYPIVPLAFLYKTGMGHTSEEIRRILENIPVTVTGGMNFARAPWNNPALNGAIALLEELKHSSVKYAMVHGNGGLGYKQGVAFFTQYPSAI